MQRKVRVRIGCTSHMLSLIFYILTPYYVSIAHLFTLHSLLSINFMRQCPQCASADAHRAVPCIFLHSTATCTRSLERMHHVSRRENPIASTPRCTRRICKHHLDMCAITTTGRMSTIIASCAKKWAQNSPLQMAQCLKCILQAPVTSSTVIVASIVSDGSGTVSANAATVAFAISQSRQTPYTLLAAQQLFHVTELHNMYYT